MNAVATRVVRDEIIQDPLAFGYESFVLWQVLQSLMHLVTACTEEDGGDSESDDDDDDETSSTAEGGQGDDEESESDAEADMEGLDDEETICDALVVAGALGLLANASRVAATSARDRGPRR